MPNAIFLRWIQIWIVGAENLTIGSRYLELAATFLTIVTIFVKCETIVTRARVGSDCIATLMLTTAVIFFTLVNVCLGRDKMKNW